MKPINPQTLAPNRWLVAGICFSVLAAPLTSLAKETDGEKEAGRIIQAQTSTWREGNDSKSFSQPLTVMPAFPEKEWWLKFNDPHLNGYIQEAFLANHQLAIAAARITESQAVARQSLAREFPQVSLAPSFSRSRNSATFFPNQQALGNLSGGGGGDAGGGLGGGAGGGGAAGGGAQRGGGGGGGAGAFFAGQTINFYSIPIQASYEPDIWLKNRDKTRAENRERDAVSREYEAIAVSLPTEVATAYFNLVAADELIRLQEQRVSLAARDVQYAEARLNAGVANQEEIVIRQSIVTNEQARLQDYIRQQALALNQLALLLGRSTAQVAELPRSSWQTYMLPATVEAGIPSELVARRPDILAAEDRLERARINVRVARKEFLPSFNLTGQVGLSTIFFNELFDWDSRVASLGVNMTQSLFSGGLKRANLKANKARYEQMLHQYQQTILQSFKEVDDALASLKSHRNAYNSYESSVRSLEQRLTILENRVRAGVDSESELNPVRLEIANSQVGLVQAKLLALTDTLSLYKAVGGGY